MKNFIGGSMGVWDTRHKLQWWHPEHQFLRQENMGGGEQGTHLAMEITKI